ncbi:MAG: ribose-phosphate pyrophosphokinase [Mycoplasmatales bacterium]
MRLFALNSNEELAQKISEELNVELSDCFVKKFADGEIQIDITESIRNDIIFVIQSTSKPVNDNLMELLIFIDALKRASAKEINVVIPYFGYARQDRKARSRQPITAKLVANLIEKAGADRVITNELHASQIQGFFDIPVDHLTSLMPIKKYVLDNIGTDNVVVVSPDHGGVKRARKLAKELADAPLAIIDKRRPRPNEAEIQHIVGDVKGKVAIMVDDMVDTAGTLTIAAQGLVDKGAKEVYAICVHGVLSDPAVERINNSVIKKLIITDSIKLEENKKSSKIEIITTAEILSTAIQNVYEGKSMKDLFGGN